MQRFIQMGLGNVMYVVSYLVQSIVFFLKKKKKKSKSETYLDLGLLIWKAT